MLLKTLGNYVLAWLGIQLCVVETQNNTGLNKIEIYSSLTHESCSQVLSASDYMKSSFRPAGRGREERTLLSSQLYDLEVLHITVACLS